MAFEAFGGWRGRLYLLASRLRGAQMGSLPGGSILPFVYETGFGGIVVRAIDEGN